MTTRPITFKVLVVGFNEPRGPRWVYHRFPSGTRYDPMLAAESVERFTARGPERYYVVTLTNGPYRGKTALVLLADAELGCRLRPVANPLFGRMPIRMWWVQCAESLTDFGNGNPAFWRPGAPGFTL